MGVHTQESPLTPLKYVGVDVHLASRIMAAAHPDRPRRHWQDPAQARGSHNRSATPHRTCAIMARLCLRFVAPKSLTEGRFGSRSRRRPHSLRSCALSALL